MLWLVREPDILDIDNELTPAVAITWVPKLLDVVYPDNY